MRFLYHISIYLLQIALSIASLFNDKARKWVNGRKNVFRNLENQVSSKEKYIWIHCASLGEFEQGRPIIEGLKKLLKNHKIILTFFSPSGYEVRKDYEFADIVSYLPIDTIANARKFIEIIQPQFVVFVKYEFWFNYLSALGKQKVPVIFISSIFRPGQYFFKHYAAWFRKQLAGINHFFVQNEESKRLLQKIGIERVTACGDTRFDRVFELAKNPKKFEIIETFRGNHSLIVAGSTWLPDEDLLIPVIEKFPNHKFIIAPHEVHASRVEQIQKRIGSKAALFSKTNSKDIANYKVLIVDSIGILAHLYQYAKFAYIGGGFGSGLHNIQEPVTFGIPVIFGPKFLNFQEAVDLINLGGAFAIRNSDELENVFLKLTGDQTLYEEACRINQQYVAQNIGATSVILKYLSQLIED